MNEIYHNIRLVGTHFRDQMAKDLVALFSGGEEIELVRELDNPFDVNAIKCLYADTHIGYVESANGAAWIAPVWDENPEITWTATVTSFAQPGKVRYPLLTIEPNPPA